MIWRALFPRGRIQGLDPRGVVLRACSREHDAQKAERAMSTRRRWVLHAEKGHAQTPDTAAFASAAAVVDRIVRHTPLFRRRKLWDFTRADHLV